MNMLPKTRAQIVRGYLNGELTAGAVSMTTETTLDASSDLHKEAHPNCVVCGPGNESGLRLEFPMLDDGSVQTHFNCDAIYEGFPGMLHGGVITSLLDGAMTNCLFAHGRSGVTGELKVRFCHPVATDQGSLVRAWIEMSSPPYHLLKAELIQNQQVKARATGKFVEQANSQAGCRQRRENQSCGFKVRK